MLKKFKTYLNVLPLTKAIMGRIDQVIKLNTKIKNDAILDIFICEMKNDEGARTYTSLWFFTSKNCIECKDFLTTDDFDITPYVGKVQYCSIEPIKFNLDEASEKSSVKIHFKLLGGVDGNLIATEKNCEKAFEIYQKYIVANIAE